MEATQTAHESFFGVSGPGIEPGTLDSAVRDATVRLSQQALQLKLYRVSQK